MKYKKYNVGDKIFAKVKGYPAWPAIVTQVNKSTYSVRFYGTLEVGACKPQDLFYYLKYKGKFTKKQKRKDFLEAVAEIETAILECDGKDGSSENTNILKSKSEANFNSSSDEVDNKKRRSTGSKTQRSKKKQKTGEDKSQENESAEVTAPTEDSVQETESPIPEECPTEVPTNTDEQQDTTIKIFPKTGPLLRIGDIKVITSDYLKTVVAYGAYVEENKERYESLPMEKRSSHKNELVLVKTKSNQLVGIKYNRNRGTYMSEYQRSVYDDTEARTMLSLKSLLECGQCIPDEDVSLFETNLDITDAQIQESTELALIESKKQKLDWLKIENKLAELDVEIKTHLGLKKANPEAAANALDDILKLNIESLMLIKHPSIFDMAKRLRKYIGNVSQWDYTDDECEKFGMLAGRVRNTAEEVYNKFVAALKFSGKGDAWDYYLEQVARFKQQIMDMTECRVFALTAPPNSRTSFFDKMEDEEEFKEMVDRLGKSKMTSIVHLHI